MATPAQSSETRLQLRRAFAAPRQKVFEAWTQHEQLEKWMCRDVPTHGVKYLELDVRTGGRYVMKVTDAATNEEYTGQGSYREVTPPEKLVFTWAWERFSASGEKVDQVNDTLVTVEFHERGNSTELVLTHEFFPSAELRDQHRTGWNACFDMLVRLLEA